MGNEKRFVIKPLEEYFKDPNRSGAHWKIKYQPRCEKSATGWDLQVERKNQILLIEGKYFKGSFLSSFAGLIASPLANRPQKMKTKKYRSWCADICWAIGPGYGGNIYQILFDYIQRNIKFWQAYSKTLKVKYIFFVSGKKVAKIRFNQLINIALEYKDSLSKLSRDGLKTKREIANQIMKNFKFA